MTHRGTTGLASAARAAIPARRALIASLALVAPLAAMPADARTAAGASRSDGLGACQRAVSRIGAQMGHELSRSPDGYETYVFTIRSDGGDYRVPCDATTASLGTVERLSETRDPAGR